LLPGYGFASYLTSAQPNTWRSSVTSRSRRSPRRRSVATRSRRRCPGPPRPAAPPAPDPTVENPLAALAVEHVPEVRVPLLLGARDDQQLTDHRRLLRPDEHPPSSPSFGSSRSGHTEREPCQLLSGALP